MSDIVRMKSVQVVQFGVVKIVWLDGYEAVIDLRPVLSAGDMFAFLRRSPDRFSGVKLSEFGHSIYWLDDQGDAIDFGADSLRRRAVASGAERPFPVTTVDEVCGSLAGKIKRPLTDDEIDAALRAAAKRRYLSD